MKKTITLVITCLAATLAAVNAFAAAPAPKIGSFFVQIDAGSYRNNILETSSTGPYDVSCQYQPLDNNGPNIAKGSILVRANNQQASITTTENSVDLHGVIPKKVLDGTDIFFYFYASSDMSPSTVVLSCTYQKE